MLWLCSDPHLGNENILGYCNRPYRNPRKMNKGIISNINKCLKPDDFLIIVGDFTLKGKAHVYQTEQWIRAINCKRKILVLGNHDVLNAMDYVKMGFWSVHTHLELPHLGAVCVHDTAAATMNRKLLFICGHVHDQYRVCKNVLNVCLDAWNLFPISERKVLKIKQDLINNGTINDYKPTGDFIL